MNELERKVVDFHQDFLIMLDWFIAFMVMRRRSVEQDNIYVRWLYKWTVDKFYWLIGGRGSITEYALEFVVLSSLGVILWTIIGHLVLS